MTEHVPDLSPTNEPKSPDPAISTERRSSSIKPLDFITGRIVARCQDEHIDVATMSRYHKPHVSTVVGEVLASQTDAAIENFERAHPGAKSPYRKVPGQLSPALSTYYRQTGSDDPSYRAGDKVVSGRILDYERPLLHEARTFRSSHPEIHNALELAKRWTEQGLIDAADSATAVVAAYGMRIAIVKRAQQQSPIIQSKPPKNHHQPPYA